MAIEVISERPGQTGASDRATRIWRVHGTTDMAEAKAAVQAIIDDYNDVFDGKPFANLEVTEPSEMRATFDITAVYKPSVLTQMQPGEGNTLSNIQFDTGGDTSTIFQPIQPRASLSNPYYYNNDRVVPGGINVTNSGEIQGVEVEIESFDFTLTIDVDDEDVTAEYLRTLYISTKKVNSDDINIDFGTADSPKVLTFYAGELFLRSVNGGRINSSTWQFAFNLRFAENRNGYNGSDKIPITELGFPDDATPAPDTAIAKDGHDYLWVYYEAEAVAVDDSVAYNNSPIAAYADKVYRRVAFSALGLPSGA